MNKEVLNQRIENINEILYAKIPLKSDYDGEIIGAVEYSLKAGGKRIRPLLMETAFDMFAEKGADRNTLHTFMAAIEYIHTYSLVHDDLPCMDNAEYRRGKLTTHIKFGEAFGVLAGDALLTEAFQLVASGMDVLNDPQELKKAAKALYILSYKAGIQGMVGGQCLDVYSEKNEIFDLCKDQVDYIYDRKTAALIEASLMIGTVLAGALDTEVHSMEAIGKCVGFAFQIRDDILDKTSDLKTLGKDVGADDKNEKNTYVDFLGLSGAEEEVRKYTDMALGELKSLNRDSEFLKEIILYLCDRIN